MNNLIVASTLITTILSSCSLFNTEPSPEAMHAAVAKWQKIEASDIIDFTKSSCEAGRINYLYACEFSMRVKDGPLSEKSFGIFE